MPTSQRTNIEPMTPLSHDKQAGAKCAFAPQHPSLTRIAFPDGMQRIVFTAWTRTTDGISFHMGDEQNSSLGIGAVPRLSDGS